MKWLLTFLAGILLGAGGLFVYLRQVPHDAPATHGGGGRRAGGAAAGRRAERRSTPPCRRRRWCRPT